MSSTESDSLRELTEFALAWSAKHNKCFVGLEVDPTYVADAASLAHGNPKIVTTARLSVLPLILRRAQFATCANIADNQYSLMDILQMTTQAGDFQAMESLRRAALEVVKRERERAAGVESTPVPGTHLSVIEGGLASEPKEVPLDKGPYKPPHAS